MKRRESINGIKLLPVELRKVFWQCPDCGTWVGQYRRHCDCGRAKEAIE